MSFKNYNKLAYFMKWIKAVNSCTQTGFYRFYFMQRFRHILCSPFSRTDVAKSLYRIKPEIISGGEGWKKS
jgi:hypothetical protein